MKKCGYIKNGCDTKRNINSNEQNVYKLDHNLRSVALKMKNFHQILTKTQYTICGFPQTEEHQPNLVQSIHFLYIRIAKTPLISSPKLIYNNKTYTYTASGCTNNIRYVFISHHLFDNTSSWQSITYKLGIPPFGEDTTLRLNRSLSPI
jgi:hypothetical protein